MRPARARRRSRRAGPVLLAALAIPACGTPVAAPASATGGAPVPEEVAGLRVTALPRPTPGWLYLSLWVDAGSRDAGPPQVATVAALVAASRAGAEARVLPDGTEIARSCPRAELESCVQAMLRALGTRSPTPEEVRQALDAVMARRRAAAADPERAADAAALEALLGTAAGAWQPLGRAEDDGSVTTRSVGAFLETAYGPARALLAAAGAVTQGELVAAVDRHAPRLLPASAARAARQNPGLRSTVQVAEGSETRLTVATWTSDAATAAAVASAALSRTRARLPGSFSARAFAVRGGAVALLRAREPSDPPAAAAMLAYALGLAAHEAPRTLPQGAHGSRSTPPEAARGYGREWITRARAIPPPGTPTPGTGTTTSPEVTIAMGASMPTPDRSVALLRTALERAQGWLDPRWRGTADEHAASVVLDEGARLRVIRRSYDGRVSVAIRCAGGSGEEPKGATGSTALASAVWATVCPALGHGVLEARLADLNARMEALVDSRGLGVLIEADASQWREAVDLAWQCAPLHGVSGADVERARRHLLAHLGVEEQLAAWAARVLSPDHPGLVARVGDAAALAGIDRADVNRVLETHLVGARLTAAIVGAVPVDEALGALARRAAPLAAGRGPRPLALGPPGSPVESARWEGPGARVVVAWRTEGSFAGRANEARAFARAVREGLERVPGVRAVADGGDAGPWGAWAAVAVELDDADEASLEALPDHVRTVIGSLETELARVQDQVDRIGRWEAARHRQAALALVRASGGDGGRQHAPGPATGLSESLPRYVIGRPPRGR